MHGVIPYPQYMRLRKLQRTIFIIAIVFGVFTIIIPPVMVAHADLFGYYVPDVYDEITENVNETNTILSKAFKLSRTSPYDVVNGIPVGSGSYNIALAVRNASKTMGLVVATLLLMVDFFRKSINFEWASKWENILIFLIKILVVKQVIQNSDTIVGYLYSMFDSINKAATSTSINFLPNGNLSTYKAHVEQTLIKQLSKGWWDYWYDKGAGNNYDDYYYKISEDAIKMFYPNAKLPSVKEFTDVDAFIDAFPSPTDKINFFPTMEMVKLQPLFIIMKAIAYVIFVVIIGRVFELSVYTIFAPLPLATFASETTNEVAKNFIKNYIATVIQVAVIVIMFIVYAATDAYVVAQINTTNSTKLKFLNFIVLCALGLGVMKSGTWAKKVCGIG